MAGFAAACPAEVVVYRSGSPDSVSREHLAQRARLANRDGVADRRLIVLAKPRDVPGLHVVGPLAWPVVRQLDGIHVLVDYTSHQAVRANTLAAIERGVAVVIGSSRLGADRLR
jgi:hypothetical protein